MAQIYETISWVGFGIAAIALALGIFFWFKFDIWKVKGELSRRLARKRIAQMRESRQENGELSNESVASRMKKKTNNQSAGAVQEENTVPLPENVVTGEEEATVLLHEDSTEVLDTDTTEVLETDATEVLDTNETEILETGTTEVSDTQATEMLESGETEVLSPGAKEVSQEFDEGTQVLQEPEAEPVTPAVIPFEMIQDIILVHTDETI